MYTAKINAASNNIPTTFDRAAGSLIISSAPSGGILAFLNTTDTEVYVTWGNYPGIAVPSSSMPGKMLVIPAAPTGGSGMAIIDKAQITQGDSVFIMTEAGSARTSGKVWCTIL